MGNNKPKFDWKKFKEYVNTYEPKKHGLDDSQIIIKDMIYGLGLSADKEKYQFNNGFKEFIVYLKTLLNIN